MFSKHMLLSSIMWHICIDKDWESVLIAQMSLAMSNRVYLQRKQHLEHHAPPSSKQCSQLIVAALNNNAVESERTSNNNEASHAAVSICRCHWPERVSSSSCILIFCVLLLIDNLKGTCCSEHVVLTLKDHWMWVGVAARRCWEWSCPLLPRMLPLCSSFDNLGRHGRQRWQLESECRFFFLNSRVCS